MGVSDEHMYVGKQATATPFPSFEGSQVLTPKIPRSNKSNRYGVAFFQTSTKLLSENLFGLLLSLLGCTCTALFNSKDFCPIQVHNPQSILHLNHIRDEVY